MFCFVAVVLSVPVDSHETSTHIVWGFPECPQITPAKTYYRQVSNKRRTLVGNKIVDHSDVVAASPVGAAPTTSSWFST